MFLEGYCNFMIISRERKTELEAIARDFCIKNGLDMKGDIFKELKKIGFDVYNVKFENSVAGMILVDESQETVSKFKKNKVILYDANKSLSMVRFIVMHELAHYVYEKHCRKNGDVLIALMDHSERYSDDVNEQEKDFMAAAMLIPKEDFIDYISKYYSKDFQKIVEDKGEWYKIITDDDFIEKVQSDYKVDRLLVTRRIQEVFEAESV